MEKKFTDLLDQYLLALGYFNQVHQLYQMDPLQFTKEYEEASLALKNSKDALNDFFATLSSNIVAQ